jgi:hypothetical protein
MKKITFLILLFSAFQTFGQLGFCNGSKGLPIFTEDFLEAEQIMARHCQQV